MIVDTRGARLYLRSLFLDEAWARISRSRSHSPHPGSAQLNWNRRTRPRPRHYRTQGPLRLPSEKLAELGLELPAVATPVAAYVPAVIDRGVVRTSGQIPVVNGEPVCIGAVGEDGADPEDAKDAARVCALNALAAAASVAGGIDNLAGVVKVVGFVSSRPDFYGQAGVINGASELFGEIFGSQHARSAVGVAALPLNVSVEVEAEFLIK